MTKMTQPFNGLFVVVLSLFPLWLGIFDPIPANFSEIGILWHYRSIGDYSNLLVLHGIVGLVAVNAVVTSIKNLRFNFLGVMSLLHAILTALYCTISLIANSSLDFPPLRVYDIILATIMLLGNVVTLHQFDQLDEPLQSKE